jgi:hypothetical protein
VNPVSPALFGAPEAGMRVHGSLTQPGQCCGVANPSQRPLLDAGIEHTQVGSSSKIPMVATAGLIQKRGLTQEAELIERLEATEAALRSAHQRTQDQLTAVAALGEAASFLSGDFGTFACEATEQAGVYPPCGKRRSDRAVGAMGAARSLPPDKAVAGCQILAAVDRSQPVWPPVQGAVGSRERHRGRIGGTPAPTSVSIGSR